MLFTEISENKMKSKRNENTLNFSKKDLYFVVFVLKCTMYFYNLYLSVNRSKNGLCEKSCECTVFRSDTVSLCFSRSDMMCKSVSAWLMKSQKVMCLLASKHHSQYHWFTVTRSVSLTQTCSMPLMHCH